MLLNAPRIKMVSYSTMKRTSSSIGESISKSFQTSYSHTTYTQELQFGENNTETLTEMSLVVRTSKTAKAAGCDEI